MPSEVKKMLEFVECVQGATKCTRLDRPTIARILTKWVKEVKNFSGQAATMRHRGRRGFDEDARCLINCCLSSMPLMVPLPRALAILRTGSLLLMQDLRTVAVR